MLFRSARWARYPSVPTVLPNTKVENDELNTFTELTANGKFSSGKGGENVFVDIIVKGFTLDGATSAEEAAKTVAESWNGYDYLMLKNDAWLRLQDYYKGL